MSRQVNVVITDDIDGSGGAEPVSFGFDGVTYEIDLAAQNRTRLEQAFAPFIAAGRRARVPGRGRANGSRPGSTAADRAAVRQWARAKGLQVSERGRISAEILRRYEAGN